MITTTQLIQNKLTAKMSYSDLNDLHTYTNNLHLELFINSSKYINLFAGLTSIVNAMPLKIKTYGQ